MRAIGIAVYTAVRNRLRYLPKGRRAVGAVTSLLCAEGWSVTRTWASIGLQGPEGLHCNVSLATDAELREAKKVGLETRAAERFREALVREGYPRAAADQVRVFLHSAEEIARIGWQYWK